MSTVAQTVAAGARILAVDDDPGVIDYLAEILGEDGYRVTGTTSPEDALRRIQKEPFDLVLTDVEMPGMRGPDLMAAIHRQQPGQIVLVITAFGSIDLAVQCLRNGAADFITKPFRHETLRHAIERALRERQMRRELVRLHTSLAEQSASGELVARSEAMRKAASLALRAAQSPANVLLTGESGAGKGLLARHIHDRSARRNGPFVQVNCAALPGTLAESELFGARRGAFTDAQRDRSGLFEQAAGGTLFLDEIGEMPLDIQPKLLQAIETRKIRPIGAESEVEADVRIICATNQPLEVAVKARQFRQDLYYRLNVVRIDIPPLRDRPEDIQPLIDRFLQQACQKAGRELPGISVEALRWMLGYQWPGNVRELAHTIERAVVLAEHDTLSIEDVRIHAEPDAAGDFLDSAQARELPLAAVEDEYIRRVLMQTQGNVAHAARILGIDRRTLYRRVSSPKAGE